MGWPCGSRMEGGEQGAGRYEGCAGLDARDLGMGSQVKHAPSVPCFVSLCDYGVGGMWAAVLSRGSGRVSLYDSQCRCLLSPCYFTFFPSLLEWARWPPLVGHPGVTCASVGQEDLAQYVKWTAEFGQEG